MEVLTTQTAVGQERVNVNQTTQDQSRRPAERLEGLVITTVAVSAALAAIAATTSVTALATASAAVEHAHVDTQWVVQA